MKLTIQNAALSIISLLGTVDTNHAHGVLEASCQLPIYLTYFQKKNGFYCQGPNRYLESQYGCSFSEDTNGVPRHTINPHVYVTVHEVVDWNDLLHRLAELDPGVSRGNHTPALFWDGRTDIYWHADSQEDTISTTFRPEIDAYIQGCLEAVSTDDPTTPTTEFRTFPPTSQQHNATAGDDGCSLNESYPGEGDVDDFDSVEESRSYEQTNLCFSFFYNRGCPHCAAVQEHIDGILRNTNITFSYNAYDVHKAQYSQHLLWGYEYFEWTGDQVVPTIFIGSDDDMLVLVGENSIFNELLPRLQELQDAQTPCYNFGQLNQTSEMDTSNLNWGVITAAALVDSINPCAIAVLIILLGGLVVSVVPPTPTGEQVAPELSSPTALVVCGGKPEGPTEEQPVVTELPETEGLPSSSEGGEKNDNNHQEGLSDSHSDLERASNPEEVREQQTTGSTTNHRRKAFFSGMTFILAVFIAYYAMGFGIFTAVASTQVSGTILLVLGILIIFLGIWNIKDFFCYELGYNVEIPRSWRPLLKRILRAVSSPVGAFVAGFVVCLFELPCTGGPYLFILGLLADKNTKRQAALLLLYYNFIFVLPLIIINCLVYCGMSTLEKVDAWKEKYIRRLHLFAGVVLISLGVLAVIDSQHPLF